MPKATLTEILAVMPAGMVAVSREKFWAMVMAETRDIHPRPERNFTNWEGTHTRQPWGWCSQGYVKRYGEPEIYAVLASLVKA